MVGQNAYKDVTPIIFLLKRASNKFRLIRRILWSKGSFSAVARTAERFAFLDESAFTSGCFHVLSSVGWRLNFSIADYLAELDR